MRLKLVRIFSNVDLQACTRAFLLRLSIININIILTFHGPRLMPANGVSMPRESYEATKLGNRADPGFWKIAVALKRLEQIGNFNFKKHKTKIFV